MSPDVGSVSHLRKSQVCKPLDQAIREPVDPAVLSILDEGEGLETLIQLRIGILSIQNRFELGELEVRAILRKNRREIFVGMSGLQLCGL